MAMRRSAALIALLAAASAAGAAPAAPGRYEAQLCVATQPDAAPSCGAAEVEVTAARISVRIADIVYRLALKPAQLDVETMHGRMQIDEFSAPYEWEGATLRFSDAAKDVRYEVRIGARKGAAVKTATPS
jgi:membrane-bound lytic murein transglycosylase B